MNSKLIKFIVVLGVGLFIYFATLNRSYFRTIGHANTAEMECLKNGNEWSTTREKCITRKCYENMSCGTRSTPSRYCKKLERGDHISEVYFYLGNPQTIKDQIHLWPAGKASSRKVVAKIVQDKLVSIECSKRAPYY